MKISPKTVQPLASPPGTPDDFDLARIAGWQTADPVALLNRQRIRRGYLGLALAAWALVALLTICLFILTGWFPLLLLGYAVTLPYLYACYQFRTLSDRIAELALYCALDGC